jgi:hypothetical protein
MLFFSILLASRGMNIIPDDQWHQVATCLVQRCPRLTPLDLEESQRRIDLLTAKIQNRHWVSRVTARRTVLGVLQACGGVPSGA